MVRTDPASIQLSNRLMWPFLLLDGKSVAATITGRNSLLCKRRSYYMKHFSILCLFAALLAGAQAYAGVIFTLGNNPQQPTEENILFTSGQTGAMVTGTTNMSDTTVDFSSATDMLAVTANGQAMVGAVDGAVNDLTISLAGGATYQDLIFNPFLGGSVDPGPATVTVMATDGSFTFTYPGGIGKGQNFLTITTDDGASILSTTIDASTGFQDLQQPRISGISSVALPEPGSFLTLAGGLVVLAGLFLQRRKAGSISAD